MEELVGYIRHQFLQLGDPRKAAEMAAYMKTDMPFYGVQKPQRELVYKELLWRFPITSRPEYEAAIEALWAQPHREEKYTAIHIARSYPDFITVSAVPLYKRLIREGAWWDLVDENAVHLVGHVLLHQRKTMKPKIEKWIDDRDMWIRRAALICHIKHKSKTDERQLLRHCRRRAHEKEFFIRKAIGWALREYAYTAPEAVRKFLRTHQEKLSPLSFREAAKHLKMGRQKVATKS